MPVLFATGRSPVAAAGFRDAIGCRGPMVFYNGAAVIDLPAGTVLASTPVAPEVIARCAQLARGDDLHFQAFVAGDRLLYEREGPEADQYFRRTGLRGSIVDLVDLASERNGSRPLFLKCMFIADSARLDRVSKELEALFGGTIYRARSHATLLEVMAAGVSKGNALRVALSLRGIAPEHVIAFGDAENDIPMLEAVGWGVAVGHVSAAVQAAADDTTPSATECGVAAYLEQKLGIDGISVRG